MMINMFFTKIKSVSQQVKDLVECKDKQDSIALLLAARFLNRVKDNFESFSDEEQLNLLQVLPNGYMPLFSIIKNLLDRTGKDSKIFLLNKYVNEYYLAKYNFEMNK